MSDTMATYTTVLDGFERVLRAVPADRWESPAPCEGWSTIDVAGHVIGGVRLMGILAAGEPQPERPPDRAHAGDDPVAGWEAARAATAAALTPEALARRVRPPAPRPRGRRSHGALDVLPRTEGLTP